MSEDSGYRLTWRRALLAVMEEHAESWSEVVACTLSEAELVAEFDPGYGTLEGRPFGVWSVRRVYSPVCYDGAEFVASVPRDPAGSIGHIGEREVRRGLWSPAVRRLPGPARLQDE